MSTAVTTATSSGDDVSQRAEAAVDTGGFLGLGAFGSALLQPFRPGEVDEVEHAFAALARRSAGAAQREHEDGVGAGGALVGLCGGDAAVFRGCGEEVVCGLRCVV